MGGGFPLHLQLVDVEPVVHQVAAELATRHPDRDLVVDCNQGSALVRCDAQRVGQLLSNLLGNAFTHGAKDEPITVRCATVAGVFELSVSNGGEPIPDSARARLFHPFVRGEDSVGREGLGLGLYIASEIAKAHAGELSVTSSAERTTFTFSMPLTMVADHTI
jgi:signal transduction histidine kinase